MKNTTINQNYNAHKTAKQATKTHTTEKQNQYPNKTKLKQTLTIAALQAKQTN